MNWLIEHTPQWNSWLALFLFWMPAVLCTYGYSVEFVQKYRAELAERAAHEAGENNYFIPSLTVGWIVGHVVLAVMPVFNLFAAVFDVAPKVFGDLFEWIGKALDIPLVPKRKK